MKLLGSLLFVSLVINTSEKPISKSGPDLRKLDSKTPPKLKPIDENPPIDMTPLHALRAIKEENKFYVGRHLIVETEDGEIHLNITVKFMVNRATREIKVRFECENEDTLLDSIRRAYAWD